MQVCPSVPPKSGTELQSPRATQPGQFWEQLESAARDKQKMTFFSWQEDFFRFISYTVRCIQVIIPVRQYSPSSYTHCLWSTHSWAPPASPVLHHSSLQGEAGWSQGIQHWPWGCSSSGSPVVPLHHTEHCDFRVCCKFGVHVWKPGIFSPWHRHKQEWRRERVMEKNLMLL